MRNHSDHCGCSLIEVLIATTLLAIGVASLTQLYMLAIGSNLASTHRTRGAMLAAQKLEELRSVAWGPELRSGSDGVGEYARRWSVDPLPQNPGMAVIIDVVVSWNRSQVGHLATIKARRAQ
jgi:hypothetical protein